MYTGLMSKLIEIFFNKKTFKLGETTPPVEPVYSQVIAFEADLQKSSSTRDINSKEKLEELKSLFEQAQTSTNNHYHSQQ